LHQEGAGSYRNHRDSPNCVLGRPKTPEVRPADLQPRRPCGRLRVRGHVWPLLQEGLREMGDGSDERTLALTTGRYCRVVLATLALAISGCATTVGLGQSA